MKGANYQDLTASAYVDLCLCASENQPLVESIDDEREIAVQDFVLCKLELI